MAKTKKLAAPVTEADDARERFGPFGMPQVWTDWSVAMVRQALVEHELGEFYATSMLAEHMMRDDRVFAALDQRVLGCLGLPYRTEVSEDTTNGRLAERLVKAVDAWWWKAVPESTLADMLRWAILMGWAIAEIVWCPTGEGEAIELRPTLRVVHPQFVRFSHTQRRFIVTRGAEAIVVEPGDGRWVLLAPTGASRPWMNGAVRALAVPWLIRTFGRRDWARRSEIDGVGVRKAYVPRSGASKENVDAFLRQVQRLGVETTLRLVRGQTPQESFDFSMEVTDANASQGFARLIGHCDTAITLAILGQNLTTEIEKGGSYAAAGVHARVLLDRLEADVAMLSTVCREQVIVPWGVYNRPDFDPDAAPWPHWDTTPPEDLGKRAQALLTVSQAIANLTKAGVDVGPVLERFELRAAEQPPAVAPAPAPAEPQAPPAPPVGEEEPSP
jgi:phage gp29-like protein